MIAGTQAAETPPDLVDILAKVEIFRTLRREDLQEIGRIAKKRHYAEGEIVVSMGDVGEEMFVVQSGAFQAFQFNQKLGLERTLVRLAPGNYFGEISLLSGGKRTASVRAELPSEVLVLARGDLMGLLERCPGLSHGLLQGLAKYVETHARGASFIPFAVLSEFPNLREVFTILPARISLYCQALVVAKEDRDLTVAMVNPYDDRTRQFVLNVLREYQVSVVAIAEDEFDRFRDRYLLSFTGFNAAAEDETPVVYISPSANRPQALGGNLAGEYLARVFRQAAHFGASDLHLHWNEHADSAEPLIRIRLDGQLAP